jgi:ankyrin repeat protein
MYLILGYFSALYTACENGNLDIVSYLISKGVDMEGKGLHEHYTPLFVAQFRNHTEILELLRNAGAVQTKTRRYSNIRRQNICTLL